jgi:arginine decarboxylase
MESWSIDKARALYNIQAWSGGYFDITTNGHVCVTPNPENSDQCVDIYRLVGDLRQQGVALPVLVRFSQILHHRVSVLGRAFEKALKASRLNASYTAVYPIKVNQQRQVVDEIVRQDSQQVGLEAGSKAELLAVLALSNPAGGTIVCNGYKDRDYIRRALIGSQLGHRVFIVIEKMSEIRWVIEESRALGITPRIGVRVRLASIAAGKWQNTGGAKSKFGLSASQVLQMIQTLRSADMLDCLQLLHFHMGSQIANLEDIQIAMRECARYFSELHRCGVNINTVDVGGGLGVDYEGTNTRSFCSINYSVDDYAETIVSTIAATCDAHALAFPDLITEAGRAMTAHHAVLIVDVVESEHTTALQDIRPDSETQHVLLQKMERVAQQLGASNALERYHQMESIMASAKDAYLSGDIDLALRAILEQRHEVIAIRIRDLLKPHVAAHREILDKLKDRLADKYFCNFSLFQSVPDIWAIDQIFPIMPLHRLDEEPDCRGVLEDITCDSDGRVDHYVLEDGIEGSLALHRLVKDEPYLLGFFMVGAYQEILGDIHNLFGDTNSVQVSVDPQGEIKIDARIKGETARQVLRHVQIDADELATVYAGRLAETQLDAAQQEAFLAELSQGLDGYTYLTTS